MIYKYLKQSFFLNNKVPDSLLTQIIRDRLNQKDCTTKGWVMIGFPRTREQAESLARTPIMAPTRYDNFLNYFKNSIFYL